MCGEGVVRLRGHPIVVIVLRREIWTGGYAVLEKLSAEGSTIRHILQHDTTRTCTLARNGDTGRIAVEEVDVLLDPLQSQVLVEDACVDSTFAVNLVGRDEAKSSKLNFNQSMSVETTLSRGTYSVLNGHTNEGVVIRAHDGRQILPAVTYAIAAWPTLAR